MRGDHEMIAENRKAADPCAGVRGGVVLRRAGSRYYCLQLQAYVIPRPGHKKKLASGL